MGFVQFSFYYIYCYMYIFKMWRILIYYNFILYKICICIKNIFEKNVFNFFFVFENQNKFVRCFIFNGVFFFIFGINDVMVFGNVKSLVKVLIFDDREIFVQWMVFFGGGR